MTAEILIVMGVSGSGKSTVAGALADRLGWPLAEGDRFPLPREHRQDARRHPAHRCGPAAVAQIHRHWIAARLDAGGSGIVTCSAFKHSYRDLLSGGRAEVLFLYLKGSQAVMADHLAGRHGHFMPASLLASQFDALEEPSVDEPVLVVDAGQPVEAIVSEIVRRLDSVEDG